MPYYNNPNPPTRTYEAKMSSLEEANRIRFARAADKKLIHKKELDAREILVNPPEYWYKAKISELILALPYVKHAKVEKILLNASVPAKLTIKELDIEQVLNINKEIERYCPIKEGFDSPTHFYN